MNYDRLSNAIGILIKQVNWNRRGVLTSFKSKSLDLLGTSRILPPHHQHQERHRVTDESLPGRDAAAERRRRLFRRKKANSASCSYDESPSGSQQSRSSSVESNHSTQHAIQRGLEAALKTSTLFAWSSVEASSANQHLLQQTNPPSFVERKCPPSVIIIIFYYYLISVALCFNFCTRLLSNGFPAILA